MKTVNDTALLFRRSGLQLLRNPIWLVVGFSTPLLYLTLFTPLLDGIAGHSHLSDVHILDSFLPGVLSLLAFASGTSLGFATVLELQTGVTERLRVTPASRLALLLGPVLAVMVAMFAFDAVLVVAGTLFGFDVHPVGLLILAVLLGLLMMTMAALSISTALLTKEITSFAAVIYGVNLPVLLLAGVLLPITFGPAWIRLLAHFNPLFYLVAASRTLAAGAISAPATWQAFAVLVPLCALSLSWATRVYRQAVA